MHMTSQENNFFKKKISSLFQNLEQKQIRSNKKKLSSHSVPDFEKLYGNFVASLEKKKGDRVTTVAEPFSFDQRRVRMPADIGEHWTI